METKSNGPLFYNPFILGNLSLSLYVILLIFFHFYAFILFTVPQIQGFQSSVSIERESQDKRSNQPLIFNNKNNLHFPYTNHTEDKYKGELIIPLEMYWYFASSDFIYMKIVDKPDVLKQSLVTKDKLRD